MADINTPFSCAQCGGKVYAQNQVAYRLYMHGKQPLCRNCMRGKTWTKATYREYLRTDHWKRKRAQKLKQARNRCQICGSNGRLEVHHNNYSRLGHELDSDLLVVCQKHHKLIHDR